MSTATSTVTQLPLTGKALLDFVKANPTLNRSALAKRAGFIRYHRETGKPSANLIDFQAALLQAKGVDLPGSERASRHSYEAYVQRSGALSIGTVYTQELGVGPADRFGIELIKEGEQIGFKVMLIERTEGSPLPVVKPKKKKADAAEPAAAAPAAPAALEPATDPEDGDEEEEDDEEEYED